MNKLYNATDFERASADFYPTPPDLTRGLIDGLAQAAIALPGPILEPCCGAGALANVLATESGLKVVGSDLYPERYTEAAALYATTSPVDARDAWRAAEGDRDDRRRGVGDEPALRPRPPPHRRGVPSPAARRLHPFCRSAGAAPVRCCWAARTPVSGSALALRIVMPWRPEWIEGTKGGGTISSTWWVWTAEPRPSALPGTVWVKRRPCASTRTDGTSNRACLSAFGANGRAEPSMPSENSEYPLA